MLLLVIGVVSMAYVLTHRQTEAQQIWDETLEEIPTP